MERSNTEKLIYSAVSHLDNLLRLLDNNGFYLTKEDVIASLKRSNNMKSIDKTIRTVYHRKQFSEKDFDIKKGEYFLKRERNADYCRVFFDALVPYKTVFFKYAQTYYRCFMAGKPEDIYPKFYI